MNRSLADFSSYTTAQSKLRELQYQRDVAIREDQELRSKAARGELSGERLERAAARAAGAAVDLLPSLDESADRVEALTLAISRQAQAVESERQAAATEIAAGYLAPHRKCVARIATAGAELLAAIEAERELRGTISTAVGGDLPHPLQTVGLHPPFISSMVHHLGQFNRFATAYVEGKNVSTVS